MLAEFSCFKNMMVRNFQLHYSSIQLQTLNRNGTPWNRRHMAFTMQWPSGTTIYSDLTLSGHKTIQKILNGKKCQQGKQMANGICQLHCQIPVDVRCLQQGGWLPLMIGRCQGDPGNTYSFDQYVSYIYPRWPCTHTHSKTCKTVNTTPTDTTHTSTNDIVNPSPTLAADQKDTLKLI